MTRMKLEPTVNSIWILKDKTLKVIGFHPDCDKSKSYWVKLLLLDPDLPEIEIDFSLDLFVKLARQATEQELGELAIQEIIE